MTKAHYLVRRGVGVIEFTGSLGGLVASLQTHCDLQTRDGPSLFSTPHRLVFTKSHFVSVQYLC